MKKTMIIMLVLIISLSLFTACDTNLKAPAITPETKQPVITPGTNPPVSSNEYVKGSFTETEFASQYLDLKFILPEGFVMATEEEMREMMGLGSEIMDLDSDLVEYAMLTTVYEMMALNIDGSTNVIVFSEKLSLRNITVEQYFAVLKSQLQEIFGMECEIDDDIVSVEIAGCNYEQMTVSVSVNGVDILQQYVLRKIDDRMVGFLTTTTHGEEDVLSTLMEGFSKY